MATVECDLDLLVKVSKMSIIAKRTYFPLEHKTLDTSLFAHL